MAEEQLSEGGLECIQIHRSLLEERIDPDSGLLDKLLKSSALTRRQFDSIHAPETFQDRNARLLSYILEGHLFDSFIASLRDSRQNHIVNFLSRNGEYEMVSVGNDWPLTDHEIRILDTNHGALVDLIEPDDLIVRLFSTEVINKRHKDFIYSRPTTFMKNEALLGILRRCSLDDYLKFIKCLNDSNQSHISEILTNGGVIVGVRVELEVPNVNHVEQDIANSITNLLSNQPLQESNRILQLVQLQLLAIQTGHSLLLYFYCRTLDELDRLNDRATTGQLKDCIERTCNELRNTENTIRVTIFWTIDEYRSYKTRFGDDIHFVSRLDVLDKRSIIAVTEFKSNLCVLCYHPVSVLLVSNEQPFTVENVISADDIEMPCDMVATPQSDCVYITDMAKECVWKVNLPGGEITEWMLDISWPFTISVCKSGCLMMLQEFTEADHGNDSEFDDESFSDTGFDQNYRLEFYREDTFLDNHLKLPDFIIVPFHAVENSRSNFIISFKGGPAQIVEPDDQRYTLEDTVEEMIWGICEINKYGERLHCFFPQNPFQCFRLPCHLALDADDRVFVADQDRNQVILLDSRLDWSFLSKPDVDQNIRMPKRLWFDKHRNLLLVVHADKATDSGVCSVYTVHL